MCYHVDLGVAAQELFMQEFLQLLCSRTATEVGLEDLAGLIGALALA